LFGGAMALQAHVLEALAGGRERRRRGGRPLWTTLDHPLATADGYVAVSVEDGDVLHRLCRACDLAPDAPAPAGIEALIAERIVGGVTADWEERLPAAGVPCAAVCTDLASLPGDAQLVGLFEPLGGTAWAPIAPWRLV
jgi:crotonobetainyl-CoA:carnitine CoA-transferase CaiB-like acyl-CoA transferase